MSVHEVHIVLYEDCITDNAWCVFRCCFMCEYFVVVMSLFAWIEFIDTSTLLVFLVVFLCGLWLLSPPGSPVNWPPGPKLWPLIGSADVLWNNDQINLTFAELAKKYCEIVHLRLGPRRHMIVLTGQDVIREAIVNKGESFGNRPTSNTIGKYTSNGRGKFALWTFRVEYGLSEV